MSKVQESLFKYNDNKFFSRLVEAKDEKAEAQLLKDGLSIIKKGQENFKRFESAAGGDIKKYAEFWKQQQKFKEKLKSKFNCQVCYLLFEGGHGLCLYKNEDGKHVLGIIKLNTEEGEQNPIFKVNNKEVAKKFAEWGMDVKEKFVNIKKQYNDEIVKKQQAEEERVKKEQEIAKRKKLDTFLSEK